MSIAAKAVVLGLITALVGFVVVVVPALGYLEINGGLAWLFKLRGPRSAPEEVVIVTIDRVSSDKLGLPSKPEKWPRSLHAQLIHKLVQSGAAVIVFDILFEELRDPNENRLLAEAIREAGNVVLFEYVKKEQKEFLFKEKPIEVAIERRIPPVSELADAATVLAPFPLPKVPARISQCWVFKGGKPTLPTAALQLYARPYYGDLLHLLREIAPEEVQRLKSEWSTGPYPPDITRLSQSLRALLLADRQLRQRLLTQLQVREHALSLQSRFVLAALIDVLSGKESLFLDFYGPPLSITTIPYYQALEGVGRASLPISLQGKVVFVGFSEQLQPEQKDGFYTVFSQPDGLDISGVEIAATVFGNLLERRHITPLALPLHYLLLALWGMVVGFLFLFLPSFILVPATVMLGVGYLGVAYSLFAQQGIWLPVVVPLIWQLPLALLGSLLWRYLAIGKAIRPYFPKWRGSWLQRRYPEVPSEQIVQGICLATDVQEYTQLAEHLELEELRSLLNDYFQVLFAPIVLQEGFISDVKGDAILAIWTSATRKQDNSRERACLAALDVIDAVAEFNRCTPEVSLPTRIGLHCGKMLIGSVGSGEHLEFRPVGDVVNATSRIENLNKRLGTRVLASSEVVAGIESVFTRRVGCFRVVGKEEPLVIHELVGRSAEVTDAWRDWCQQFEAALRVFQSQRWQEATFAFKRLLRIYRDDGPSSYYLRLSQRYAQKPPPAPWDGVVDLGYEDKHHLKRRLG